MEACLWKVDGIAEVTMQESGSSGHWLAAGYSDRQDASAMTMLMARLKIGESIVTQRNARARLLHFGLPDDHPRAGRWTLRVCYEGWMREGRVCREKLLEGEDRIVSADSEGWWGVASQ